ncbi:MAG TPA: hypothetical protein VLB68_21185 [Pyrinomonadaceae bacterium]|nr:hypothetical protein [Pyrinomonadaceae bacterium]
MSNQSTKSKNESSGSQPYDPTQVDNDPANPMDESVATAEDQRWSPSALTNYGDPGVNEEFDLSAEETLAALAPQLSLDITVARDFLKSCMTSSPRVKYGLGAKISPHGATPGSGFKKVDCSGFVRETIWRATTPHFNFPDGSVVQHDWIKDKGFERSTRDDAFLQDGKIRIVFLRPQDAPSHVGHVALVHNGTTLESHGSFGPNSREWTNTGWQAKAFVYLLKD